MNHRCGRCSPVVVQDDYEVTPDEKRRNQGDKIIKTFLSKQVGSSLQRPADQSQSISSLTKEAQNETAPVSSHVPTRCFHLMCSPSLCFLSWTQNIIVLREEVPEGPNQEQSCPLASGCAVCLCVMLTCDSSVPVNVCVTKSPQHVNIVEVFADQCRRDLEQSACKEIFSTCRR